MANLVKLKRSAVAGKAPVVGDLALGELALNTRDGKLYAKTSDGASEAVVQLSVDSTVVKTTDTGTVTSTMLLDGTILNADVNASAAIAGTKISPDFGSQTVQTTGIVSHALGTALAPTVTFTGDTNTGLYSPGADQVAISTNGTGRLFVDASGQVGIGSAPSILFDVVSTSEFSLGFIARTSSTQTSISNHPVAGFRNTSSASGNGVGVRFNIADSAGTSRVAGQIGAIATAKTASSVTADIYFAPGGTERARIDSSGRLLIGTSSNTNVGSTAGALVQTRIAAGFINFAAVRESGGAIIALGRANGNAAQVLSSGDEIGVIRWAGADGTDLESVSASIQVFVDGAPGANNMPGRLVLSVTADGASSPSEALRITNDRVVAYNQPDVTSKAAAATLTVAELKTKIIQYTGAAATLTLPTGTLTEGGFSGIYTNMTFEWSVINTGSGLCTIGAGTGHTIVGGATVATGASGRFASRRTAANTFVTYRLS